MLFKNKRKKEKCENFEKPWQNLRRKLECIMELFSFLKIDN